MPTIPTVTSLKRVIPQGERPAARVRNAGAIGDAAAQFGNAVVQTGDVLDRRARYDAAMAEEEFLSRKYELDNEIENDNDYATIPQRYDEKLAKVREEIGSKLKMPGASQMFTQRARIHSDRGVSRAKGVSLNKEREFETARIDNVLTRLSDTTSGDDDPLVGLDVAENILAGGVEAGYFIAPKAEARLKDWKDAKIKRKLDMMSPEQRIAASEQPWFKQNLPADIQAGIIVQAREQNRQTTAMVAIEDLRKRGLSGAALESAISAEKDPKMRDAMRTEADQAEARARRDRVGVQNDLLDKYFDSVLAGRVRVSDIPAADRAVLGSGLASLASAERAAADGIGNGSPYPKHSDPGAIDGFNAFIAKNDYVGAREFFNNNRTRFSESDFQAFSKVSMTGVVPPEVKSYLSVKDRVANKVGAGTAFATRRNTVETMVDQWYQNWQADPKNAGKTPPPSEIDKTIDAALLERSVPKWFGLSEDKVPAADIKGADIGYQRLMVDDPEFAQRLRVQFPKYTEAQLYAEYNNIMRETP